MATTTQSTLNRTCNRSAIAIMTLENGNFETPSNATFAFEKYRNYLYVLAQSEFDRRLNAKLDVSGVIQQTMLDAHLAVEKPDLSDEGDCLAWLRKLLARNLIDEIRKFRSEKRDVDRECHMESDLNQSAIRLSHLLCIDSFSPSQRAVSNERILQLTHALQQLPEMQHKAIIQRYFFNTSITELAHQLNRSESAVAGLLKRGLAKLRDLIDHQEDIG